eukprot:CAMPEP_0204055766 /NCGR_PEP_ID=MMETSP0360-20130528/131074_1 /ASSEMBLY_ACC=CAM_ASM_000342 /TAXON_ID=268821 /ORGANISM="Scrippsiella Hangoei, Strain SHTV-5" /LENGTH=50 /DNA_ID=CAMNT_0051003137 /DNA_START=12 /DNA_END=164 /DNA_ORIENTATION=+
MRLELLRYRPSVCNNAPSASDSSAKAAGHTSAEVCKGAASKAAPKATRIA